MGLTSPALSYLLAFLSLGLLVAVVACWRRLAGPGLKTLAWRSASLLTLQACVLALIFVTVNQSGEFYSSWSDLFGSDTASASVTASASGDAARIQPVVVTAHTQVRVPGDRAAGGILQTVRFTGELSGLTVPGRVFLPAGYRAAGPVGHYPVVVAISNDLGRTSSPYGAVRLAQTASREIAAGRLEPVIMVMLPAELARSDQGCLNLPAQTAAGGAQPAAAIQASTFFTEDIPAIMESAYAASNAPGNWGLLGDSSGGYCALQLTLTNSWVLSAAVMPDGSYSQPPGGDARSSPQVQQQDNMIWLLRNQPMQPVSLLFTGPSFGSDAGKARAFVTSARRPTRVSTMAVGGGIWPIASALGWLGKAIGPHAQRTPQGLAG